MKLQLIKWLDAVASAGWDDVPKEPTMNTSVGFVVYETEDYIQLAGTLDSMSSCYNNSITIPWGMVVEHQELPYEDKQCEGEGSEVAADGSDFNTEVFSDVKPVGCEIHFDGSNGSGCYSVFSGGRIISSSSGVQESCSDSDLQGLCTGMYSRCPRTLASD